jgi:1-acyl-sn-glycerol-3-phosphate acyltransferase
MKNGNAKKSDDPAARVRPIGRAAQWLYGLYAWAAFSVCMSAAILSAIAVPGLDRRRRWVSAAARAWLASAGIRTRVTGIEHLPAGHCVVVANHSSYLDGLILQAFLPPRFTFVIKGEMQKVPLAHLFLRRIGSRFVERFAATGSSRDARNLLRAAAAGESLALFPEGTFHPDPGLQRFRPGAFAAAIRGRLPIVPIVIQGSRHILPAGRILPRRGDLRIDVLEAIHPGDPAFCDSRVLSAHARQRILTVLTEPDLAATRRPKSAAGTAPTTPGP